MTQTAMPRQGATAEDPHDEWLRRTGIRVHSGCGVEWWQEPERVLTPVIDAPQAINLTDRDAARLLAESGAWLIRYPAKTSDARTDWYYVVCDQCPPLESLHLKVRYNVRTGLRRCTVAQVDKTWVAEHGYECYTEAMRKRKQHALSRREWESPIRHSSAILEWWAVNTGGQLAGYCANRFWSWSSWVEHSSAVYHPDLLKHRSAYALVRTLQEEYVLNRHLFLTNGTRTMVHDSHYNEVLENMGFRRSFCQLGIYYNPTTRALVQAAYPLRALLAHLHRSRKVDNLCGLLAMEGIRRKQASAGSG